MITQIYEYKLIFTSSNNPTVDEINQASLEGWQCIQIGHREAAPNQWAYMMQRVIGEIEIEYPPPASSDYQDDFERPDGDLGPNWTIRSDFPAVISAGEAVGSDPGTTCSAYWSAGSFTDDQFSEATLGQSEGSVGVLVRADNVLDRCYLGAAFTGTLARIYQRWDGTFTVLAETDVAWVTGDVIRLAIEGSVHPFVVSLYRNNVEVLSWTSTSSYQEKTGGSPGITLYGQNASIQSWKGGNIEAASTDIFVGTFTVSLQENRILISGHGLSNGDQIKFVLDDPSTCSLPTPLTEVATYFVVGARGNDFQVSSTSGGPVINMTDRGIGSNEVWKKG
jgi:hypothetical protein